MFNLLHQIECMPSKAQTFLVRELEDKRRQKSGLLTGFLVAFIGVLKKTWPVPWMVLSHTMVRRVSRYCKNPWAGSLTIADHTVSWTKS